MNAIASVVVIAAAMLLTGAAQAEGGEDLAKKSGCLNCHAVDTKKVGPSYKDLAKRFQGKSRTDVVAAMKSRSVHSSLKTSDKDLSEIAEWIQKL